MNKHESKPRVAPPAAYKAPSLPTLAALGAVSAAAMLSGCKSHMAGGISNPTDYREPADKKSESSLNPDIELYFGGLFASPSDEIPEPIE